MDKLPPNYQLLDSRVELTEDVLKEPDESDVVKLLKSLSKIAGYTRLGGGTHVREAEERQLNNRRAVGRDERDSLQHDCTNPQITSESPSDSASMGFSGRSPLSTAAKGAYPRKSWNGRRPVKTWDGLTKDRHGNDNELTSYTTIPSA